MSINRRFIHPKEVQPKVPRKKVWFCRDELSPGGDWLDSDVLLWNLRSFSLSVGDDPDDPFQVPQRREDRLLHWIRLPSRIGVERMETIA